MAGSAATVEPRASISDFPLGLDTAVAVSPASDHPGSVWQCSVRPHGVPDSTTGAAPVEGATEAFVDVLRHTVTIPADGYRVVRLVPPPEATGERPILSEPHKSTVVVGERVVVTWFHRLSNVDTPTPLTCAHLAELRFLGVPITYGALTWRSATGRELPCAVATGYLPRSRTGWEWCPDLVEQAIGARTSNGPRDAAGLGPSTGPLALPDSWVPDFPRRVGRLVAKFHVALATPSSVIPDPVQRVGPEALTAWRATALTRWNRLDRTTDSDVPDERPDDVGVSLSELRTAIDGFARAADRMGSGTASGSSRAGTPVQRIHGNLHLGQLIRWPGGLAIAHVDHDPMAGPGPDMVTASPLTQPAARDLATLLVSLDEVVRITGRRTGVGFSPQLREWLDRARDQLLEAYRAELDHADAAYLLDEELVPAFEAEQRCLRLLSSGSETRTRY
jgi:maltokinase